MVDRKTAMMMMIVGAHSAPHINANIETVEIIAKHHKLNKQTRRIHATDQNADRATQFPIGPSTYTHVAG